MAGRPSLRCLPDRAKATTKDTGVTGEAQGKTDQLLEEPAWEIQKVAIIGHPNVGQKSTVAEIKLTV